MSDRSNVADEPTNGMPALSERVRELRLTGKLDGGKTRNNNSTWLPWTICILLAFGWAGFGIKYYRATPSNNTTTPSGTTSADAGKSGVSKKSEEKPKAGQPENTNPEAVLLEVKGYLIPTQQISISPIDVAGRIVKLNIEEGMSFKKGEILAEIEQTPLLASKAEAVAQMASAKAKYAEMVAGSRIEEIAQAFAELEDARELQEQYRREWQRFETQKSNAITTKEYEVAEANYRSGVKRVEAKQKAYDLVKAGPRKEKIEAAEAEYNATKARLAQVEWKLDNCTIRSPVTGIILTKKAEIGSLLNPVVGGVATSLCEIADLRKLEVDLEVQERDISKIKQNLVCKVRSDAYPERVYEGYVERMMPIANRAKSVVPVRIKVVIPPGEKQGSYLKPEMGVSVTFLNREVTDVYKAKVKADEADDEASVAPPKK
ncbi:HlyD family secretion protein [Zavarzinella formosa]|uniref:HlyD family secretion protein n=1 Tax=Zavarzinella formosa TaxID=360055 RepID=UPI0002F21F8E|nr:efflux RND transporter periplasmic adaptor subunit [Zavarzinella formosa]